MNSAPDYILQFREKFGITEVFLNKGATKLLNHHEVESFLTRLVEEAEARGRNQAVEHILQHKHWIFTAPYGLEIDDDGTVIPRSRGDDEYIKVRDIESVRTIKP